MSFSFVRRVDGITYEFRREADLAFGYPSFRRVDVDLSCRRVPEFGWCVLDSAGGVSSRPFDDPGVGALPPTGAFVSRKDAKSYVYDLIWN